MRSMCLGVLGAFFLVLSCGYRFSSPTAKIPQFDLEEGKVYTLFLALADNKTEYAGLEAEIPAALAREVSGLNNLKLVSNPKAADFILATRITDLSRGKGLGSLQGTTETQEAGGLAIGAVTAREYKVSAKADIDFFKTQNGNTEKLWTKVFSASATYDSSLRLSPDVGSSSSSVINASRERMAMQTLAQSIAKQFKDQVFQGF